MSYKKAAILYGIVFILQFSLLNLLSVAGITPNLILCLMIFITYKYNDGYKPALLAIPFALFSDSIGGQYVGVSALSMFILCVAIAYFGRNLNRENLWTILSVAAIGTVVYNFLGWLILLILGNPTTILELLRFLLAALPANLFVILIAYLVFIRVYRRKLRPTGYAIVDMGNRTKSRNKINLRNMR